MWTNLTDTQDIVTFFFLTEVVYCHHWSNINSTYFLQKRLRGSIIIHILSSSLHQSPIEQNDNASSVLVGSRYYCALRQRASWEPCSGAGDIRDRDTTWWGVERSCSVSFWWESAWNSRGARLHTAAPLTLWERVACALREGEPRRTGARACAGDRRGVCCRPHIGQLCFSPGHARPTERKWEAPAQLELSVCEVGVKICVTVIPHCRIID